MDSEKGRVERMDQNTKNELIQLLLRFSLSPAAPIDKTIYDNTRILIKAGLIEVDEVLEIANLLGGKSRLLAEKKRIESTSGAEDQIEAIKAELEEADQKISQIYSKFMRKIAELNLVSEDMVMEAQCRVSDRTLLEKVARNDPTAVSTLNNALTHLTYSLAAARQKGLSVSGIRIENIEAVWLAVLEATETMIKTGPPYVSSTLTDIYIKVRFLPGQDPDLLNRFENLRALIDISSNKKWTPALSQNTITCIIFVSNSFSEPVRCLELQRQKELAKTAICRLIANSNDENLHAYAYRALRHFDQEAIEVLNKGYHSSESPLVRAAIKETLTSMGHDLEWHKAEFAFMNAEADLITLLSSYKSEQEQLHREYIKGLSQNAITILGTQKGASMAQMKALKIATGHLANVYSNTPKLDPPFKTIHAEMMEDTVRAALVYALELGDLQTQEKAIQGLKSMALEDASGQLGKSIELTLRECAADTDTLKALANGALLAADSIDNKRRGPAKIPKPLMPTTPTQTAAQSKPLLRKNWRPQQGTGYKQ